MDVNAGTGLRGKDVATRRRRGHLRCAHRRWRTRETRFALVSWLSILALASVVAVDSAAAQGVIAAGSSRTCGIQDDGSVVC